MEFFLVAEIYAHDGPIRCCCVGPNGELVTGSQANSTCVRRWALREDGATEEVGEPIYHDHWVTALTALPPGQHSAFPEGCVVSGCMDAAIRVFDAVGNPILHLAGHAKGVISLSWTPSGQLVSGSWDGSAKVWEFECSVDPTLPSSCCRTVTASCVSTLGPMENGVHVLGMSNGLIAATSTGESVNEQPANFFVRFWDASTGSLVAKIPGDAPIRSIVSAQSFGNGCFATTANDGTVCVRSSNGLVLSSFVHPLQEDNSPPFVLDCCALQSSFEPRIVSCGEDGSVAVWNAAGLVQSIPHPSCVWCVCGLPNGDFVTGGHDGKLRVFSCRPERVFASDEVRLLNEQFVEEVATCLSRKRAGPSAEEISKAAKWEDRAGHHGKSDGQVMVFNKSGTMIAAQWEGASRSWMEIGEVTGSQSGGEVNGEQYDHVLPVEMETGQSGEVRTFQLGFNDMETSYDAAQRFLDQNGLPGYYLKQIADWITKQRKSAPTLDFSTKPKARPSLKFLPLKSAVLFDDVTSGFSTKLVPKVKEWNQSEGWPEDWKLSSNDLFAVEEVIGILSQTSRYHASSISQYQLNGVLKLSLWPQEKLFVCYDILRLVAIHPQGSACLSTSRLLPGIIDHIIHLLNEPAGSRPSCLMAVRFVANCCRHDALQGAVLHCHAFDSLVRGLVTQARLRGSSREFAGDGANTSSNRNIRLAISAATANFCWCLTHHPDSNLASLLWGCTTELMNIEKNKLRGNAEAVFHGLLSLGTLAISNQDIASRLGGFEVVVELKEKVSGSRWGEGVEVTTPIIEAAKEVYICCTESN